MLSNSDIMSTDAVLAFVMALTPKADHSLDLGIRKALVPLPLHYLKELTMALSSDLLWGISFQIFP